MFPFLFAGGICDNGTTARTRAPSTNATAASLKTHQHKHGNGQGYRNNVRRTPARQPRYCGGQRQPSNARARAGNGARQAPTRPPATTAARRFIDHMKQARKRGNGARFAARWYIIPAATRKRATGRGNGQNGRNTPAPAGTPASQPHQRKQICAGGVSYARLRACY